MKPVALHLVMSAALVGSPPLALALYARMVLRATPAGPESKRAAAALFRASIARLAVASALVFAALAAWVLLDRHGIAGPRHGWILGAEILAFHALWWPLAMPAIARGTRRLSDEGRPGSTRAAARPGADPALGPVRRASLRPRRVRDDLPLLARVAPGALGTVAALAFAVRAASLPEGTGLPLGAVLYTVGGLGVLVLYGIWVRFEVAAPQHLLGEGREVSAYRDSVERQRRFRVRGVWCLGLLFAGGMLGLGCASLEVARGALSPAALGIAGGVGGALIGLFGAILGIAGSVRAHEVRARRERLGRPAPVFLALLLLGPLARGADTVVMVDPGEEGEFLAAATVVAEFHEAPVVRFEAPSTAELVEAARLHRPEHVILVAPPGRIDVDFAHDVLEAAVRVDGDPFLDFAYGFITGRDGAAARAFAERAVAAHVHEYGRRAGLFGSWEGRIPPVRGELTGLRALGFTGEAHYVMAHDSKEERARTARRALGEVRGKDALLFFSHGYPDEMAACFRAEDLRAWEADLGPAVLVNCACYNGAPGRWYAPGPTGPVDRGVVPPEESVALQILDSGVPAYVAGVDPWHGPLAFQVFELIAGEGMSLGAATRRMFDRLAIEFLPERIAFAPTREHEARFAGEGPNNRRHNGGGMIFYGDPALRPFPTERPRRHASLDREGDRWRVRLGVRPLVQGAPGEDFMLPVNALLDYYSVESAQTLMRDLAIEIHDVVPLPQGVAPPEALTVLGARCGEESVPVRRAESFVEETPRGRRLHVRVVPDVPWFPPGIWPARIAREGITVELSGMPAAGSRAER